MDPMMSMVARWTIGYVATLLFLFLQLTCPLARTDRRVANVGVRPLVSVYDPRMGGLDGGWMD